MIKFRSNYFVGYLIELKYSQFFNCIDQRGSKNYFMNKSKQIQEEYSHLRNKVQGRIKQLQSKLAPQPSPTKPRIPLLQLPLPQFPQHQCHPIHHCSHSHTCRPCSPIPSLSHIDATPSEMQSLKNVSHKNSNSVNELLSQALVESLKNQKELNNQIKVIHQRIENLSQHNRSNISQAFSESVKKHYPKSRGNLVLQREINNNREEKFRCRSQLKSQQSIRQDRTQQKKYKIRTNNVSSRMNDDKSQFLKSPTKRKIGKSKLAKSKSGQNVISQYFLSFGCPLHSPNKVSLKSVKMEIYKDSEYRNRKHQKNHLLESFKQQQRSRKRLISKIAQNAFSQYGKK